MCGGGGFEKDPRPMLVMSEGRAGAGRGGASKSGPV